MHGRRAQGDSAWSYKEGRSKRQRIGDSCLADAQTLLDILQNISVKGMNKSLQTEVAVSA